MATLPRWEKERGSPGDSVQAQPDVGGRRTEVHGVAAQREDGSTARCWRREMTLRRAGNGLKKAGWAGALAGQRMKYRQKLVRGRTGLPTKIGQNQEVCRINFFEF
jgi:hypothetical protein